jgi:glycosyltransferase involved in cell wall biosynthesis
MEKIKVLEIVPNMQQGGLENLIMNILRNIDKEKYEVHFLYHYTSEYFFDREIGNLGGIIHKCSFREDKNLFKYVKFLNEFFNKNSFDVVHSHMLSTSFFTLKYARKYGCKVLINHAHNSTTEKTLKGIIKRIMISKASKYANVYLACSKEAGEFAYPNKNYIIINNCIDLEKFKYSEENRIKIRKKLNIKDSDIVFGNIGRLNIQKNQIFLIEAFSKIKLSNAKLMIIGFGELKEEIEKKINELNIKNKVILLENVQTELYYSAMDCFVLTSKFEGFPLTAVEAQANGCPCIFSSNITDKVKINPNVQFLNIDNVEEWTNKFNDFYDERISNISNSLREYDINNLMKIINKIYTKGKSK